MRAASCVWGGTWCTWKRGEFESGGTKSQRPKVVCGRSWSRVAAGTKYSGRANKGKLVTGVAGVCWGQRRTLRKCDQDSEITAKSECWRRGASQKRMIPIEHHQKKRKEKGRETKREGDGRKNQEVWIRIGMEGNLTSEKHHHRKGGTFLWSNIFERVRRNTKHYRTKRYKSCEHGAH